MVKRPLPVVAVWHPKEGGKGWKVAKGESEYGTRLSEYQLEDDAGGCGAFESSGGIYTAPCDGLYLIIVGVGTEDGALPSKNRKRKRNRRDTAGVYIAFEVPDEDEEDHFHDIGGKSSGSIYHVAKGTKVSVFSLRPPLQAVRLEVELIQRKRKFTGSEVETKAKKKHMSKDSSSDEGSWEQGFESDTDSEIADKTDRLSSKKPHKQAKIATSSL